MQQFISWIQIYQDQILLQNVAIHAGPEEGSMAERKENESKDQRPR